jgi:ribosomal protein L37AE/L43A
MLNEKEKDMSVFGSWECKECGSTWRGSIGWRPPTDEVELNKMLTNFCGCIGPIEGAATPVGSASCF